MVFKDSCCWITSSVWTLWFQILIYMLWKSINLNHNESLFIAVNYAGCLALANYLNQSSPDLWADWKELCLLGNLQPERYRKGSKNCRTRLHSVRWKTLRVEPSETAASFGEGGGRLQRTESGTVLKSSELQENTRPCRPVLLFSSFTPGDFTASLQSSFCALSLLSSHWTTSLTEVTVLRFFFTFV